MPRRAEAAQRSPYLLRFGVTAVLLIAGTLVLVLYVLPERYALSSGFRESGKSFPAPRTPFVPVPAIRVAARPIDAVDVGTPRGPAEVFWDALAPLLDDARYDRAGDLFESYLRDFPGDADARREYALTLLEAGRSEEAVPELRRLLANEDDFDRRLLLARTLRDLGRTAEAGVEYRALTEARPEDVALWLEWARAHAWIEEYEGAAAVLREAMARHPGSVPLRVELARVEFSRGNPDAAAAALAGLSEEELEAEDGIRLRSSVETALATPDELMRPGEPRAPPTLLEQAVEARALEDLDRAEALFEEALAEGPADAATWRAYADFLQYERGDLEAAHGALLEAERLSPEADAALRFRLAQLEIWTGRNAEARARLTALLGLLESDADAAAEVSEAEVHAMLGDLDRYDGDRVGAARRYRIALAIDPDNRRALDGTAAVDAEVARLLAEAEAPRVAATSYGVADTDDYSRVDVGGEWVEVRDHWVWGGRAGNRWLGGRRVAGVPTDDLQGVYLDVQAGRWWRVGTVRTAAHVGLERVRGDWDYSAGASLRHRDVGGGQTDALYEHGPAYPATGTLQSAVVDVVQDQVSVHHSRPLDPRWTVSATAGLSLLRADLDALPGAAGERTVGFQTALSVGRAMSRRLTLGLSTRLAGFTRPGPLVTDTATLAATRLFWDPRLAVSAGPYVRVAHELSYDWRVSGMLGPGIALLDERTAPGWDVVPHVSAEAGVRREGQRFRAALDVFFYQGQFDGYRTYGARLTFSARDWSTPGGSR